MSREESPRDILQDNADGLYLVPNPNRKRRAELAQSIDRGLKVEENLDVSDAHMSNLLDQVQTDSQETYQE